MAVKTISPDCIENIIAFKRVRLPPCLQNTSDLRRFLFWPSKRLCTNAVIWKRLQHPNVVRFLGLGSDFPPISLVYDWMSNGNLSSYVRERPNINKLDLVGIFSWNGRQLLDDPDPLSMLDTGGRSRTNLPTSV